MPRIGELVEREESVFEWTVRDFFSIPEQVDEVYLCPPFSFGGARWCLAMYPNGVKERQSASAGLGKVLGPPIELDFSIGLKTTKNTIAGERNGTRAFVKEVQNATWPQFLRRSELVQRQSELVPSGHLTFVCRIKHPPSSKTASAIPSTKCAHCKDATDAGSLPSHERKCLDRPVRCPECSDVVALRDWYAHECQPAKSKGEKSASASDTKSTSKILEDFKHLLQNQEHSDVVLRVKEQEFRVHKAILAVRSPVFASAFRNDMREKSTGVVDIEDSDPPTFSAFLRFLYYGDVESLCDDNAASLFTVADKYDVSDLREKCLEFMKENLSVDTFCDTLALALRHSETELIRLATEFFVANADKIVVTVAWQTFVAENPTEGNELFIKYVSAGKR